MIHDLRFTISKLGRRWLLALLLVTCHLSLITPALAVQLNPFVAYLSDQYGNPLTNTAVTITAWPPTNSIVAVNTNLVFSSSSITFTSSASGLVSNNLAAGNYRLQAAGYTRGVPFSIANTTNVQNLAQVANVPVVTYLNFSIAQFSDAGTMARESTNNWTRITDARLVSAITNLSGILKNLVLIGPLTNSVTTNGDNTLTFTVGLNLGYQPATNNVAFTTTSNPTNQYAAGVLYTNSGRKGWLRGWASGGILNHTNAGHGYPLPVTNAFSELISTNDTFIITGGTLTNAVFWQ